MKRFLAVMKFGGTSVGDAVCIGRAAEILASASCGGSVVAVVSAMSGVTNKLIASASRAESGDRDAGQTLADTLREQHETALDALVHSGERRDSISRKISDVLAEAQRIARRSAVRFQTA